MRNIFFDICSIPIFVLILGTCCIRKMTKGHANRVFIMMNGVSLVCAVADLWMELMVNPVPLTPAAVTLGTILSYTYKALRNGTLVIYIIYIFTITRTEYRLRPAWARLLLWLPDIVLLVMLAQNLFTHNVFTVTAEGGYARGPALAVLYAVALIYGIVGTSYCIYCKRFLTVGKWLSLLSVYVLTFIAVMIQMLNSSLLVEMFSTAVGLLIIMLLVMRPEENIDFSVGILNWNAYQTDLRNVLLTGEKVTVAAIKLPNAVEVRTYLGEDRYNAYLGEIVEELRRMYRRPTGRVEIYFEHPGAFYLITDLERGEIDRLLPVFLEKTRARVGGYSDIGVRFDPRICLINCPDDLHDLRDIINLGHKFTLLIPQDQVFCRAADVCKSQHFAIINNMEDILSRALTENRLEMYYQPIYDIKNRRFHSAEALARLNDSQYGMISPSVFIPAAETTGLILPIGDVVLESVFRFVSQNDLEALGLTCVEINLSVAQCMQRDLPERIRRLQEKYRVSPSQINFEITETTFDSIGNVMDSNLRELSDMGYRFSLDDYGIGYSNIQRLSKLPLSIIKIDKSMVDEMFSRNGEVIIQNTVHMMHDIHKELIIEGVETKEASDVLTDMSCDFIQGFYYSKPLPEGEFIAFMKAHNMKAS